MRPLTLTVVALALSAAPIFAQDGAPARRRADNDRVNAAKVDSKTTGETVRASQLIGMNIQNEQGKSLGEINDLVLDANSGKIRYAAVTYGGFLGVGDKLFAVPWGASNVARIPMIKTSTSLCSTLVSSSSKAPRGSIRTTGRTSPTATSRTTCIVVIAPSSAGPGSEISTLTSTATAWALTSIEIPIDFRRNGWKGAPRAGSSRSAARFF